MRIERPRSRFFHDCDAIVTWEDGRRLFVEVKSTANFSYRKRRVKGYIAKMIEKNLSPFLLLLLSWDKNRIFIFTKDGFRGELNPKTLKKVLEEVME